MWVVGMEPSRESPSSPSPILRESPPCHISPSSRSSNLLSASLFSSSLHPNYSAYAIEMGGILCGGRQRIADQSPSNTIVGRSMGRLLILVNPHSGAGKGLETFNQRMVPLLKKRAISYELVVTNGRGEAERLAKERRDLSSFSAVLIFSGDGLIFELVNGLCERRDQFALLQSLPIGIIPTGSGNGLLASVFATRGYPLNGPKLLDKALRVSTSANGIGVPVGLVHVQTDSRNIASFLSFGWGLLADIDIESERWRTTLGSSRFVAGALVRLFNLRSYRGRLVYLPYIDSQSSNIPPSTSNGFPVHPHSAADRIGHEQPQVHEVMNGETCSSREERDSAYSSTLSPRRDDMEWKETHRRQEIPNLEDPIPLDGDWMTLDEEFVFIYAMSKSHIATDGIFMPHSRLKEDRIYLSYALRKDVTKFGLARFLLAIETGKHVDFPFFKILEVSSFRLDPLIDECQRSSWMVVDGEVVETKRIQVSSTNLVTHVIVGTQNV